MGKKENVMTQSMVVREQQMSAIERVLASGDLAPLSSEQRVMYYNRVCETVGLNPLTRPFEYLKLNGRIVLYARRDCTDQLRSTRGVSVEIVSRERSEDMIVVTARATMPDGRRDESIGACPIAGLKGESLANAMMKTETKAKRRVTLSICGLGFHDESEVDDLAGAEVIEATAEPTKTVEEKLADRAKSKPATVHAASPEQATRASEFLAGIGATETLGDLGNLWKLIVEAKKGGVITVAQCDALLKAKDERKAAILDRERGDQSDGVAPSDDADDRSNP